MVEPKKLVLEAWVKSALPPVSVVAKRLVEVLLVVVPFVDSRFVRLAFVAFRFVVKRLVDVALVVVASVDDKC